MDELTQFPSEILLMQHHQNEICQLAKDGIPLEICGLISGKNNQSRKIYPITNIENSPSRFRMASKEQIDALMNIENNNHDLLAIYHSHPNGPSLGTTQTLSHPPHHRPTHRTGTNLMHPIRYNPPNPRGIILADN